MADGKTQLFTVQVGADALLHLLAQIGVDGQVVAIGRGVVDDGWLGLSAIAVGPPFRRRGLAQARFDTFGHPHGTVVDQFVLAAAVMGELPAARRAAEPLPANAVSRRFLLFLDGEWERAEEHFARATDINRRTGMVTWLGHTLHEHARARLAQRVLRDAIARAA